MKKLSILIVDDELSFARTIRRILWQDGFENVTIETNPINAIELISQKKFDILLLDLSMPQMDGLEVLEKVQTIDPSIITIVITAKDSYSSASKAIKLGAYDYIIKPPDIERLLLALRNSQEKLLLKSELDSHRKIEIETQEEFEDFKDIIGKSSEIKKVIKLVQIYAPTNETILLLGETGTGKDLIAKKIHDLSSKAAGPFVTVNVASLSPSLFESELFGAEKGAYTGASLSKIGFFEASQNGTIYLDEIGEISAELQAKLLRVIQYNEFYKVGGTKPITLNARIIASTNKDLNLAVKKNEFRADLFYRLTRGFINIPPLRNRKEDIKYLAEHFILKANEVYNKTFSKLNSSSLHKLMSYNFAGNIRELENLIFNAVASQENDNLLDLNFIKQSSSDEIEEYEFPLLTLKEMMNVYVNYIIKSSNGNTAKAASILGVSEKTVQRRKKKV